MLILEPRTCDDDTPESEASIGTADSSENITLQGATSDPSGVCVLCAYTQVLCFHDVIIRSSVPTAQKPALIAPGSRRQSVDELSAVSPTPRTLQTPPPLLPTTPHPPSPPTPQVLPHLTIGSAPPPQGPCLPPAVWGPLWQRQRGPKILAKRTTGSG